MYLCSHSFYYVVDSLGVIGGYKVARNKFLMICRTHGPANVKMVLPN